MNLKGFPKLFLYAHARGGGSPFLNNDFTLNEQLIKDVSRFPFISMNNTPFSDIASKYDSSNVLLKLRKHNPRIKILAYALFGDVFQFLTPDTFYGDVWMGLNKLPNGLLYGIDGQLYTEGYRVNFGNKDVINLLIEIWSRRIVGSHLFDGAFLDYCSTDIAWTSLGDHNRDLDYVRAGFATPEANDVARRENLILFIEKMKAVDYTGFLYLINGTTPVNLKDDYFNGNMDENWPNLQGGVDKALEKIINGKEAHEVVKVDSWQPPYSREWFRIGRHGMAAACMGSSYFSFQPDRDLNVMPLYHQWWMDEYSVRATVGNFPSYSDETGENVGWLGTPSESPVKGSDGTYTRRFQKGIVLLNPTLSPKTITLTADYKRIMGKKDPQTNNGEVGRVFNLLASDALFLVKK